MTCTSIVGNWYVSNAAMTLATVLAHSAFFLTVGLRAGTAYRPLFHVATCRYVQIINLQKTLYESSNFDSSTDSQALRVEYCIVGIPHNTA